MSATNELRNRFPKSPPTPAATLDREVTLYTGDRLLLACVLIVGVIAAILAAVALFHVNHVRALLDDVFAGNSTSTIAHHIATLRAIRSGQVLESLHMPNE